MLRAVLFDLDNTLVDRDRAFRECVHTCFPEPAHRAEVLQLDEGGRGDRPTLFKRWTELAGTPMNQSLLGRLIAARLQPDRELLEALRTLSKVVKLGVITNGGSETQRWKVCAAGLDTVIAPDQIWVSEEVGLAKPDPAIFLLAARCLGETPEHMLFVGDQEQDDVIGARKAGLRARLADGALNAERLALLWSEEREP